MNLNPTAAHGAIDALVADHAAQELTWQESLAAEQAKTAAVSANLTTAQTRPAAAKVASGQTMFAIAGKYGVTVDQVKGWNPSVDPANMPVGTQLWLINPSTVPAADPTPTPDPVPDPTPDPTPSGALVLGHVAYHDGTSWTDRANKVKAKYGPFQGHMRVYWGVGSSGILSAELKTWLDASPNNRLFANWKPWSTDWAQVASGGRDSVIIAAAKSWAPYAKTGQFLLTFGHEPENDGSPVSDYVPMWRRAAPLMKANAPGLKLVWTMMGKFSGHPHSLYESLWPGAQYVDIIGHDPYIVKGAAASKLPQNIIDGANDLRLLPGAANLPVIAAEWGADLGGATTDRGTDQHRADAIDAVTARLDELAACGHIEMTFYDDGSSYLSASGPDVAAYKRLKTATENR
jgi:LysM repeat protein